MKAGRHICTVCNNIYEEPDHPIECGCKATFDQLPAEWRCPECGADKDKYQPCSCVTFTASQPGCKVDHEVHHHAGS